MDGRNEALSARRGGRILDVATGSGGFAAFLASEMRDAAEVIGLDSNPAMKDRFEATLAPVASKRFVAGDALESPFPEGEFDTVGIANSLHHFGDPRRALEEAVRVLKRGGTLVVAEMYRDTDDPARMTHVLMHHYWGRVDAKRGITHNETYARADLVRMLSGLGLAPVASWDEGLEPEEGEDPFAPETKQAIESAMSRYAEFGGAEFAREHETLMSRFRETGYRNAPSLVWIAEKP
jgi:SAM-dependent methyltransferase